MQRSNNKSKKTTNIEDDFKIDEIIDIINRKENKVYEGKIITLKGDLIIVQNLKNKKEEIFNKKDKNTILLKQWGPGRIPQLYNRVDFELPNTNYWVEGIIMGKNSDSTELLIKYKNNNRFKQTAEEWININSKRISPIGLYTKYKKEEKLLTSDEINEKLFGNRKFIILTEEQEEEFKNNMEKINFNIKIIEKDGNCLFRAISDQIYGDEKYYSILREKCMDYLEIERDFFQQFIEGDFDEYINMKRKNGIWGDDIEIQALSEIYNRPIEIYSGSIKPLKCFHENKKYFNEKNKNKNNNKKIIPIRISYHGHNHYNSVVPKKNNKKFEEYNSALIKTRPGIFEDHVLFDAKEKEKKKFKKGIELEENNILEESRMNFADNKKEKDQFLDDILLNIFQKEEKNKKIKSGNKDNKEEEIKEKKEKEEKNEKKEKKEKNEKQEEKKEDNIENENKDEVFNEYLSNPIIQSALEYGFSLNEAVEAWSICGDNQEMVLNYLLNKKNDDDN